MTKREEMIAKMRMLAGLGACTLEAEAKRFNATIPELTERARRHGEEREAYAVMRGTDAFNAWLASKRQAFIDAAARDFDKERPPIEVPAAITSEDVREILATAKKGRAA